MLDLRIDSVIGIIKAEGYKTVGIQLPEGLKDRATEIAEKINNETGTTVFIFADPCYGACDLCDTEAEELGCEALFHFGHSRILGNQKIPVHYIEVKIQRDPIRLLSKFLDNIPKRIGLVTTVQHVHILEEVATYLEKAGKKVLIGSGKGRIAHNGQVLGCSFSSAKGVSKEVDGFLYIGTGDFHPLGVALSTGKKTFALDLERGELRDIDDIKEKILRRRFAQIARSKDAHEFGIIVGEKQGQRRINLANRIKGLLNKHGKKSYFIGLREISPEALMPFRRLDAFVNTACPRVSIDDARRYKKPILTPVELEIVLGERSWDDYQMDEII